ncbi:cysteine synthase [Halovibrio variabilis]|uniref:cysteine synthase n=1 Tax=Halovibrio variabilis TaxID=31910 RepID=A0A511UIY7_9GAMM|nr:cysteine synthase family protein [Halovibrio variabilis]GEN26540.1 cysteine synthase [Halovibrio variabilis]
MNFKNILQCAEKTPLVSLDRINDALGTNVVVKLEKFNPGGSIKDRAAIALIKKAEIQGYLKPGGTIIESSSGNFAISLAMIGAARGYKVIVLVDPKTTNTNISLMKAYGAKVVVVEEKDDTGSYHKTRIKQANELAQVIENSYRPDQCFNILSSYAHYESTATEIYEQTKDEADAIVCAVSTGGQIGGISKFYKEKKSSCKICCVDAFGSGIFSPETYPYKIPGVGLGWTPRNILDVNNIDYVFKIHDESAFIASRLLCRHEGILCGVSSGAVLLGALKLSISMKSTRPIIAVMGDSGERYIDTLFNEDWLYENGIDTTNDIFHFKKLINRIDPPQKSPNIYSNYRDDLIKELKVPNTTITHFPKIKFTKNHGGLHDL